MQINDGCKAIITANQLTKQNHIVFHNRPMIFPYFPGGTETFNHVPKFLTSGAFRFVQYLPMTAFGNQLLANRYEIEVLCVPIAILDIFEKCSIPDYIGKP